jgi:hypothetical protein
MKIYFSTRLARNNDHIGIHVNGRFFVFSKNKNDFLISHGGSGRYKINNITYAGFEYNTSTYDSWTDAQMSVWKKYSLTPEQVKRIINHVRKETEGTKQDIDERASSASNGGWIVVVSENGLLKPSSNPVIHLTEKTAFDEAQRLATLHTGQDFYVLKIMGKVGLPKPEVTVVKF